MKVPPKSRVWPRRAEYVGPYREGEEPKPVMHGHEKSDSVIVAVKPTNKAMQPVAKRSAGEQRSLVTRNCANTRPP